MASGWILADPGRISPGFYSNKTFLDEHPAPALRVWGGEIYQKHKKTLVKKNKEVRWEKMPFDARSYGYGHHLDEEFGWSGRNASEVVGEGKRLLRVAYAMWHTRARPNRLQEERPIKSVSIGHYLDLLVRDLQSECRHVTRTGLTNVGPAQDGFY